MEQHAEANLHIWIWIFHLSLHGFQRETCLGEKIYEKTRCRGREKYVSPIDIKGFVLPRVFGGVRPFHRQLGQRTGTRCERGGAQRRGEPGQLNYRRQ